MEVNVVLSARSQCSCYQFVRLRDTLFTHVRFGWLVNVEPVPDEAALLIDGKRKVLVIADLHVGIEAEYHDAGVTLPSQTKGLLRRIKSLVEDTGAEEIVLLGDVKNSIGAIAQQEADEVPNFLKAVADIVPVHIVPGNHDGSLSKLVPGWADYPELITVHPATGIVIEGVGLFHGHSYPTPEVAKQKVVVMGHQHPSVAFRDDLGTRMSEVCWMRAPIAEEPFLKRYGEKPDGEAIVMPAFSEYGSGSPVNEDDDLLGPFLRNGYVDLEKAKVFLIDGVYLGLLDDLRLLLKAPDEELAVPETEN